MKYKNESIQSPKCSVCHAVKGNANHWWQVDVAGGILDLQPMKEFNNTSLFICGVKCALAVVNEYMNNKLGIKLQEPDISEGAPLPKISALQQTLIKESNMDSDGGIWWPEKEKQ